MPLSRNDPINLALDGCFGKAARRDTEALLANLAEDITMQLLSMGSRFADKQAIANHFDDSRCRRFHRNRRCG